VGRDAAGWQRDGGSVMRGDGTDSEAVGWWAGGRFSRLSEESTSADVPGHASGGRLLAQPRREPATHASGKGEKRCTRAHTGLGRKGISRTIVVVGLQRQQWGERQTPPRGGRAAWLPVLCPTPSMSAERRAAPRRIRGTRSLPRIHPRSGTTTRQMMKRPSDGRATQR